MAACVLIKKDTEGNVLQKRKMRLNAKACGGNIPFRKSKEAGAGNLLHDSEFGVWDGSKVVSTTDTADVEFVRNGTSIKEGWYLVSYEYTFDSRIELTGDTYIILQDGGKLNVKGIYIPAGKTLYIYNREEYDLHSLRVREWGSCGHDQWRDGFL